MTVKIAFLISPPYMLPRMSTILRVKLMPTNTEVRVPSKSALARRAPQLMSVKPGMKSRSSAGVGRTNSVVAKSACQLASVITRTGSR